MRNFTLVSTALALVLASPAKAQQFADTQSHMPEYYGTYQCGPYQIVLDQSWKPTNYIYDGIHYWVSDVVGDSLRTGIPRNISGVYVLGLPIRGPETEFAYQNSTHFILHTFKVDKYGWVFLSNRSDCSLK